MINQPAKLMMKSRPDLAKPRTAVGNYFVMFDATSQHHLWVSRKQIYAFCHPPVRRRSRGYDAPLTRQETTGRAAQRRIEQTCACQTTRFPSQPGRVLI